MTETVERVRFPRAVFGSGAEPDPRFTLANERTFLAWNRTALALTAGGVALESLVFAVWLWIASRSRYLHFNAAATAAPATAHPGGRALLAVMLFTTTGGLVSLAVVVQMT